MTFYRLSDATFYDHINTIYQFIKPFLDNEMSICEEYRAVKHWTEHDVCIQIKFYLLLLPVWFQVTIYNVMYYVGIHIKISIYHFVEKEYLLV